jgi:toxin ParE1/3/4
VKRRLLVSERAEADLREIWHFSHEKWGADQADRYLDELAAGLIQCGSNPARGRPREEVWPGYRSHRIRSHVAFYTVTADEVLVQRVLHATMDPDLHLDDD